jgi:hypothetical protein
LALRPVNLPLEEAAAVFFGGMTVLGFLAEFDTPVWPTSIL